MSRKIFKKIACSTLAALSVFACMGTLTACETSNPEVEMQIEFNGETYELNYKLYRKVTPKTVEHFMWLVENDYYDGLCIHNYDNSAQKMYTGAYSATLDKADSLNYKKYYETVKASQNLASFPHSVWSDKAQTNSTYTLYGEYWGDNENGNRFKVSNGNLAQTFGSLTMYYEDIASYSAATSSVWIQKNSDDTMTEREYKYNCTTSQFFISLSPTEKTSDMYCTFATLKNEEVLEELLADISTYIEETYNSADNFSDFVTKKNVSILEDDAILGGLNLDETFSVPKQPIVIKSMEITKY